MLIGRLDESGERATARRCGVSPEGMRRLRSLIDERGRNSWAVGDLLVHMHGPPTHVQGDGSTARLRALGDELGCSWSWLAAARATSAGWPRRERRPSVCWAVHRHLVSHPDRLALLDAFVRHCGVERATPSLSRLRDWLDALDRTPTVGRPRQDPILAIERLALRTLDPDGVERLIARLESALSTLRTAA